MVFNDWLVLSAVCAAVFFAKVLYSPLSIPPQRRPEVVRQRWLVCGLLLGPLTPVILMLAAIWRRIVPATGAPRLPLLPQFSLAEVMAAVVSLALTTFVLFGFHDETGYHVTSLIFAIAYFPVFWLLALNRVHAHNIPSSVPRALYVGFTPLVFCACLLAPLLHFFLDHNGVFVEAVMRTMSRLGLAAPLPQRVINFHSDFNYPAYSTPQFLLGATLVAAHSWSALTLRRFFGWPAIGIAVFVVAALFFAQATVERARPWGFKYEINKSEIEDAALVADKSLWFYRELSGPMHLMDTTTQLDRAVFSPKPGEQIFDSICSNDGKYVVAEISDEKDRQNHKVRVWQLTSDRKFDLPTIEQAGRSSMRFAHGHLSILTKDKIEIWNCESGTKVYEETREDEASHVIWFQDGKKFFIRHLRGSSNPFLATQQGPVTPVNLKLRDISNPDSTWHVNILRLSSNWRFQFSNDGKLLFVFDNIVDSSRTTIYAIDTGTGQVNNELYYSAAIGQFESLPNGYVAFVNRPYGIVILDPTEVRKTIEIKSDTEILRFGLLDYGAKLYYSNENETVVCDANTGTVIEKYPLILSVYPQSNSRLLFATNVTKKFIGIYDLSSRDFIATLNSRAHAPENYNDVEGFGPEDQTLFAHAANFDDNDGKSTSTHRLICWERKQPDRPAWLWPSTWGTILCSAIVLLLAAIYGWMVGVVRTEDRAAGK